jgi:hypothetical protein
MHLKQTSPFNNKPGRSSRKKKRSDKSNHRRIVKFTLDKDGKVKGILIASGKEIGLKKYNKFDLLTIRDILKERGSVNTTRYKDIQFEIERRIASGEITPTDIREKVA